MACPTLQWLLGTEHAWAWVKQYWAWAVEGCGSSVTLSDPKLWAHCQSSEYSQGQRSTNNNYPVHWPAEQSGGGHSMWLFPQYSPLQQSMTGPLCKLVRTKAECWSLNDTPLKTQIRSSPCWRAQLEGTLVIFETDAIEPYGPHMDCLGRGWWPSGSLGIQSRGFESQDHQWHLWGTLGKVPSTQTLC